MPQLQTFTLNLACLLLLSLFFLHCQPPPEEKSLQLYHQFITEIEKLRYTHHYTPPLDSIENVNSKLRRQLDSLVPLFSETQKQRYQTLILRYQTLYEILKREIPPTPIEADVVQLLQLKTNNPLTALCSPDSLPAYYRFLLQKMKQAPNDSIPHPSYEKALILLQRWKTYYIDSLKPESLMVIQPLEAKIVSHLTNPDSHENRTLPR